MRRKRQHPQPYAPNAFANATPNISGPTRGRPHGAWWVLFGPSSSIDTFLHVVRSVVFCVCGEYVGARVAVDMRRGVGARPMPVKSHANKRAHLRPAPGAAKAVAAIGGNSRGGGPSRRYTYPPPSTFLLFLTKRGGIGDTCGYMRPSHLQILARPVLDLTGAARAECVAASLGHTPHFDQPLDAAPPIRGGPIAGYAGIYGRRGRICASAGARLRALWCWVRVSTESPAPRGAENPLRPCANRVGLCALRSGVFPLGQLGAPRPLMRRACSAGSGRDWGRGR